MTEFTIPPDAITEDNRFAVMELRDGRPFEVAATSRDGLGLCLVTLAEDRRGAGDTGTPVLGVLDRQERQWICGLWQPKGEK